MTLAGPFEIKILSAGFAGPDREQDPMLGGALRVTINGVVVADDEEFGLERSALGLLRTIDRDHDASSPIGFPTLLIHDCGFPWLACSAFGTDWTVRHEGEEVAIGDVLSFDSHPVVRDLTFPGASCRLSLAEYRNPVIRFAIAVRTAYFAGGDKIIDDPELRQFYDDFWEEYDGLLDRHGEP